MIALRHTVRMFVLLCAFLCALMTPLHLAYAQAFVPVNVVQFAAFDTYSSNFSTFSSNFDTYSRNFDTYAQDFNEAVTTETDSVRNLIAGSNPGGIAQEECVMGDNVEGQPYPAEAYEEGPWQRASEASTPTGYIPLRIPSGGGYVQINYSHSLRCLLMEIVEWQKLGLSVQIHTLLKNYIADAQTVQLSKQLRNQVSAANQNFGKAGNIVNNNGVISSQAVYNINIAQNNYNINQRQLEAAIDQAAADPAAPGPQGSWGFCSTVRLDAAANMARNARSKTEDPYHFTQTVTQCPLTTGTNPAFANETDYANFNANFNDASSLQGGFASFHMITSNPAANPIGILGLADNAADGRIARQEEFTKAQAERTGFIPTTQFDQTNPADARNLPMQFGQDVNPASSNQNNINNRIEDANKQMEDASTLDSQAGAVAEVAATQTNTVTGAAGANTLPLETSTTQVNQLIQEFYDSIQYGYFGIHQETVEWAQATMLMTYDELKFNDTNPQTFTTSGQAPVDTGN